MANKIQYSFLKGVGKTIKNSAYLLIPFIIAIISGVPAEYAVFTGPIVYFLKNLYEVKSGKKL